MASVLALLAQLLPLITSTIGRVIAERGAAQGKSDGEILRETEAMVPKTSQMQIATMARALAKKAQLEGGVSAKRGAIALPSVENLTARQQVQRMIEILEKVRDGMPA